MKKTILTIALGLIAMLTVTTSFAADANRYELAKGSIIKDGNTTAAYDLKGNWVYTITRYSSDNLPKDIFDIVKGTYYNYFVNGIEKVEQPGSDDVYIAHLENNKSIKTVRVSDGVTELVTSFKKI